MHLDHHKFEPFAGLETVQTLKFPTSRLAHFDDNQNDFVLERIDYGVFVGRDSLDPNSLRAQLGS